MYAWKADPNMSVSEFIDLVKRDNFGDVLRWHVYQKKEKVMKFIRGSVVDHYEVLLDYRIYI